MLRIVALACLPLTPVVAETWHLPGGTPTDIGTHTLTLSAVEDQRCPPDVDCIWEGLIRLTLTVAPVNGPASTVILCNLCDEATRQATVAGLTLSLAGLEPSTADLAAPGRPAKLAGYTAVLDVLAAP